MSEAILQASRCSRCGRPLKDPVSIQRGMGPICAGRAQADRAMREAQPGVVVTVNGRPLQHVVRHSPTGMEWGYSGSGPADLALSILTDYLSRAGREVRAKDLPEAIPGRKLRERLADMLHQSFKSDVVAQLPHQGWRLTGEEVAAWLVRAGVIVPAMPVVYEGRRVG
ncbi:MAG TPA: DUF6166 domain-containing protein [Thermaerobacter sp.]